MSPGVIREGPDRISHPSFLRGFTGRDQVDSYVVQASSVPLFNGNEVETITITGGPTGGTFTLTYQGRHLDGGGTADIVGVTTALAYNATGATVQAALEAIAGIGAGNVVVTGGAGGPYQATFQGALGAVELNPLTANGAGLTGGTTPGVTVARIVRGSNFDVNRRRYFAGTILTLVPTDNTKVRRYTAASGESASTIVGIGGGGTPVIDVVTAGSESDFDVPVYFHAADFDKGKIIDYALYAADLASAPRLKNSIFT